MSFFNSRDNSADGWKDKYFKLLDSQEQAETQHKANEELLCKTIVRFSLAVKGLNPALDPHLERIRRLLKSGLNSEQLQQELQAFSNALMALEDVPNRAQADAGLLFDFLERHYPNRLPDLERIQERYQRQEFINHQGLFAALAESLTDALSGTPDIFAEELAIADTKTISAQLVRLLDNADLPESFLDDAKQLKTRLQSGQALGPVLDDAVTLLLAVKKHMDVEQQELANFLSKLTEELAELGLMASGANMINEDAAKKRSLFDRDVTAQMADLQKKSATATQLEPLKQLIGIRLAGISQQIHANAIQEQVERDKAQKEMRGLMQKVRDMESETLELQSRLEMALRRATRDPLTNLPNRMALEDRLTDEIARSRRHGSPLSMAIWDIDFFKNINDSYGHKSGDKALIIIAKLLSSQCRATDFVSRFGGEEFVMLLPETDAASALILADKIRETVQNCGFMANGNKVSITLSCGIASYIEGDGSESLFERADSALYKAKQSGRNQCVVA